MKNTGSLLITFLLLVSFVSIGQAETANAKNDYNFGKYTASEYSNKIVVNDWNSKKGRELFSQADSSSDFYQLAPYYQPQINPAYCGMATLTTLNNFFNIRKPEMVSDAKLQLDINLGTNAPFHMPFKAFSQLTFFENEAISKIKTKEQVIGANTKPPFDSGINLDELQAMAKALGMSGEVFPVSRPLKDTDIDYRAFVEKVKAVTADETSFIIVNYRGAKFGGMTGGHISPIVAATFDKEIQDYQLLVLDTAGHKNPWFWVPAKDLYFAMNTIDKRPSGEEKYRGYFIVSSDKK